MQEIQKVPDTPHNQNESSRSPIRLMAEILRDSALTPEDKQLLYDLAKTRFQHRRRMAYIALAGILLFSLLSVLREPSPDVTWINTTLAAIVVAYYGASAARPGS